MSDGGVECPRSPSGSTAAGCRLPTAQGRAGGAVLRSGPRVPWVGPRVRGRSPRAVRAPPCASVCLARWVAELVAVQKLVVFFRKKASSF